MSVNNIAYEATTPPFIIRNRTSNTNGKNNGSSVRDAKDSDDDNSFLPPALSAYGLALLDENEIENNWMNFSPKTTSNDNPSNITGVYELDFPGQKPKTYFKNKHSVRFNESISNNNVISTDNTDNSINSPPSEDLMDISPNKTKNSNSNSSHTPLTPNAPTTTNSNTSISSTSNINTNKTEYSANTIRSTLRGNRRFPKLGLGPPKRASRRSDESATSDNSKDSGFYDKESDIFKISKLHTPPPSFNLELSSLKKSPTEKNLSFSNLSSSEFIESLERSQESAKIKKDHEEKLKLEKIRLENKTFISNQVDSFEKNRPDLFKKSQSNVLFDSIPNMYPSGEDKYMKDTEKFSSLDSSKNSQFQVSSFKRKSTESLTKNEIIPSLKEFKLANNEEKENIIAETGYGNNEFFRRPLSAISPNLNGLQEFKYPNKPVPNHGVSTIDIHRPNSSRKFSSGNSESSNNEFKSKKIVITINGSQYEKLELLGRGGSSKVYKVKSLSNNKTYAIKKVTFDQFDDACIKGFKGEIDLLLQLKNQDRVVKLVDYSIGEGSIFLVMECGDIDLAHVLNSRSCLPLDLNFVKYHAIEMLKCVSAVHDAGIVHSDLKPANFLFVKGVLKIIDFGIANVVPDHTANIYRESQIGTPNYMAPEALVEVNQGFTLHNQISGPAINMNTWKVGKPSDIWSCGCIIYQMIYGRPPYGGYSGNQRILAIMNPQVSIQYPEKGLADVLVPIGVIETMKHCLDRDPSKRWTVEQILNGPFLNPKTVSEDFIRDLVHSAVNFGVNNKHVTSDIYDKLVDTVLKQIDELNY